MNQNYRRASSIGLSNLAIVNSFAFVPSCQFNYFIVCWIKPKDESSGLISSLVVLYGFPSLAHQFLTILYFVEYKTTSRQITL